MISKLYRTMDAVGLADLVRNQEVSAAELVEAAIARIEEINPHLNAVIYKNYDYARGLARQPLPQGPLSGVPFLLKDLAIEWQGFPVTNGCRFFQGDIAQSSWLIAERMKRAGLLPLAKTNVPEMGWSLSTEPQLYGPTRNPWNDGIVAGASSGGSASAVASGMVPLADASDGGGSIRIPAAVNGLVGLKPSRGRITFGPKVVDFWYGAAVFLCVSRTVRDTAAYLDAVAGALPGEPYALAMPSRSYSSLLGAPVQPLNIGFSTVAPDGSPLDEELRNGVLNAARHCEQLGHRVTEFEFKYDVEKLCALFVRITATMNAAALEAAAQQKGVELRRTDVEPQTWDIYQLGRTLTATQHANDVEAMRGMALDIARAQSKLDVLITPTLPSVPRPLGWYRSVAEDFEAHTERLCRDLIFTAPFNISGQPAISLPLHMAAPDLPVGIQFAAGIGAEATLIALAAQLEQAQPWRDRVPPRFFK